jgi:transmembrane sensor
MEETDYRTFDIADFAANEHFVNWVLEPDAQSDTFWNDWQRNNTKRAKVIHEAKLLVLLMNSRKIRMPESRRDELWTRIQNKTEIHQEAPASAIHEQKSDFSFLLKIAASITIVVSIASFLYFSMFATSQEVAENPKGKKSVIFLEDGTKVWLNADSRLTYLESFEGKTERIVTLEGEAFFDVAKDKAKPFIVKTAGIEIKVLGTEFNVKSFNGDRDVQTTLVHGSVAIQSAKAEKGIVLTENEQAVFNKDSNAFSVSHVEARGLTSWKDGVMSFENTPISEIMVELERWYGVELILDDSASLDCRFSATLRNEPISVMLDLLKQTSNMNYEIKGKTVTLHGSLCQNKVD